MKTEKPFWEVKSLEEMTIEEWESLCDGCGRCCLFKLENPETGELFFTNVVCYLFDSQNCRCLDYENRSQLVPTCLTLNPENASSLYWIPKTCAYRRLAEGKKLSWWHPLVSKDPESVHKAGISIQNKAISEAEIDLENDLEDFIIDWID